MSPAFFIIASQLLPHQFVVHRDCERGNTKKEKLILLTSHGQLLPPQAQETDRPRPPIKHPLYQIDPDRCHSRAVVSFFFFFPFVDPTKYFFLSLFLPFVTPLFDQARRRSNEEQAVAAAGHGDAAFDLAALVRGRRFLESGRDSAQEVSRLSQ